MINLQFVWIVYKKNKVKSKRKNIKYFFHIPTMKNVSISFL